MEAVGEVEGERRCDDNDQEEKLKVHAENCGGY
jgi:hypothetical protein